jgi:hypothetical protein
MLQDFECMQKLRSLLVSLVVLLLVSCHSSDEQSVYIYSATYNFSEGLYDWQADFTEYPVDAYEQADSLYEWKFSYTNLPSDVGTGKAVLLSSNNVNGSLFMYLKNKLSGLKPDTKYTVAYEITLYSNVKSNENVFLKAGASSVEPQKVASAGSYTLNVDKGNVFASGENLISLGGLATESKEPEFTKVVRSTSAADPFIIQTNSAGEIWLIVGTDSGFSGRTDVFYEKINVVLSVPE